MESAVLMYYWYVATMKSQKHTQTLEDPVKFHAFFNCTEDKRLFVNTFWRKAVQRGHSGVKWGSAV